MFACFVLFLSLPWHVELPNQRLNPCHSRNPSQWSENTGFSTCRITRETKIMTFLTYCFSLPPFLFLQLPLDILYLFTSWSTSLLVNDCLYFYFSLSAKNGQNHITNCWVLITQLCKSFTNDPLTSLLPHNSHLPFDF